MANMAPSTQVAATSQAPTTPEHFHRAWLRAILIFLVIATIAITGQLFSEDGYPIVQKAFWDALGDARDAKVPVVIFEIVILVLCAWHVSHVEKISLVKALLKK